MRSGACPPRQKRQPTPASTARSAAPQPAPALRRLTPRRSDRSGRRSAGAPPRPPAPASRQRGGRPAARAGGAPRPPARSRCASPAVAAAREEAGIDLRQVRGGGPAGRISHEDLDAFLSRGPQAARQAAGLAPQRLRRGHQGRRAAPQDRREDGGCPKSRIPHITYVEEIDVTALEELRAKAQRREGRTGRS